MPRSPGLTRRPVGASRGACEDRHDRSRGFILSTDHGIRRRTRRPSTNGFHYGLLGSPESLRYSSFVLKFI